MKERKGYDIREARDVQVEVLADVVDELDALEAVVDLAGGIAAVCAEVATELGLGAELVGGGDLAGGGANPGGRGG